MQKNNTIVGTNQELFTHGRTYIAIDDDLTYIDIQHTLLPGTENVELIILRDCEVVASSHYDTVGALGSDNLYHIGYTNRLNGSDPLNLLTAELITVAFIKHNGSNKNLHPREVFGFRVIDGRIHAVEDLNRFIMQLEQLSHSLYGSDTPLKTAFGFTPKDTAQVRTTFTCDQCKSLLGDEDIHE